MIASTTKRRSDRVSHRPSLSCFTNSSLSIRTGLSASANGLIAGTLGESRLQFLARLPLQSLSYGPTPPAEPSKEASLVSSTCAFNAARRLALSSLSVENTASPRIAGFSASSVRTRQ